MPDAPLAPTTPAATARAQIDAALAALPPWGSPAWWAAIGQGDRLTPGALVALMRQALRRHDEVASRELFVAVLSRVETACAHWASRVVRASGPLRPSQRPDLAEDLRQELALHLWDQLALRHAEAWEITFWAALDFACRHVATSTMRRQGYWRRPNTTAPTRGPALPFSRLRPDEHPASADQQADAAWLDLRVAVASLPPRERLAVVMRYWHGAREHEIALALGVSTRTVRTLLAHAQARLRASLVAQE